MRSRARRAKSSLRATPRTMPTPHWHAIETRTASSRSTPEQAVPSVAFKNAFESACTWARRTTRKSRPRSWAVPFVETHLPVFTLVYLVVQDAKSISLSSLLNIVNFQDLNAFFFSIQRRFLGDMPTIPINFHALHQAIASMSRPAASFVACRDVSKPEWI